jgi:hypothetical protein
MLANVVRAALGGAQSAAAAAVEDEVLELDESELLLVVVVESEAGVELEPEPELELVDGVDLEPLELDAAAPSELLRESVL